MHVYRLDIAYLGADFLGWQSQPCGQAVQDYIQNALSIVLRRNLSITGASRTDSGVHAEHQVASFRTDLEVDTLKLPLSLNALLPGTISILNASREKDLFHPIRSCKAKIYCYRFWRGRPMNPFVAPYVWCVNRQLDVVKMAHALEGLVGTHDFTSFCASDSGAKTRVREILEVELVEKGPMVELWISGRGFLKQMVRSISGTLLQMGLGKIPSDFSTILNKLDRSSAGPTAPACGLSLVQILYQSQLSLNEMIQWRSEGLVLGVPPHLA